MPESVENLLLLLVPVGFCAGLVGSLIGVGGGFLIIPFLMASLAFSPAEATATSLGVVFLCAVSATGANVRRKRTDMRTGLVLACGTLPGAWIGRELIGSFSRSAFAFSFAGLLLAVAIYLLFVRLGEHPGWARGARREIVDSDGQVYRYEANGWIGFAAGMVVGLIASLFGVGGGLLLVPFMVIVFGTPTLVATATAQFTFMFTSATAVGASALRDQLPDGAAWIILLMGAGSVLGAQTGVAVAKRIRERLIRWILAAVLATVAVQMLLGA